MKKNILVTGGAGYLGSTLVRLLLKENYNVIVFDDLIFGGESLLGIWNHPDLKFIKGNIAGADAIKAVFEDYNVGSVVHLAAIVGDPACKKQPELAGKVNWEASINLLEMSVKNQIERFIFASTCSNYGKMSDPNGYVDETSDLTPVSLYAELKVKFENVLLNDIEKKDNFCPTSFRSATLYGVSPRMRFDLTVNEFTKELSLGRELEVFGEQFWRPYCHVYDLATAIILMLNNPKEKVAYNVFNVGDSRENYQKKMIVDEIKKKVDNPEIKFVKKNEDPRDYKVSFKKIKSELGFNVTRKVPDGVKEVKSLIDSKILLDPDDSKYRNS
tara:strand:+ start:6188 stop:7174 length:987 start_codon:yes stop_codon:yes gene_type:complete